MDDSDDVMCQRGPSPEDKLAHCEQLRSQLQAENARLRRRASERGEHAETINRQLAAERRLGADRRQSEHRRAGGERTDRRKS